MNDINKYKLNDIEKGNNPYPEVMKIIIDKVFSFFRRIL